MGDEIIPKVVVRLKRKRPESDIQIRARREVEEYYKEHPESPFINIAKIMKGKYEERK